MEYIGYLATTRQGLRLHYTTKQYIQLKIWNSVSFVDSHNTKPTRWKKTSYSKHKKRFLSTWDSAGARQTVIPTIVYSDTEAL